jgi:hypothetical protein
MNTFKLVVVVILLILCFMCMDQLSHAAGKKAAIDVVTVTLTVTKGSNRLPGTPVVLALSANSSLGQITTVVFNCENGNASIGLPPASGPLALPLTVPMSGTLPTGINCFYKHPGTYYPNVQVFDSLGKKNWTNTMVTVL